MSVVALLALNAAAIVAAVVGASAAAGGAPPRRLAFLTLCGWLVVIHSTTLAAGLVGALTVSGVGAGVAIVLVAALWWARRAPGAPAAEDAPPCFTAAPLVAPLVAAVSAAVWVWPHIAGATRLWIWDDYTYHMVYPTVWLRERAIAAVSPDSAFTMQAWYPLSASIVSTWFMLPFAGTRGDALAWVSLTGLLYAGILAFGAAELLARLGCRRGAWAVPVVLLVTSHRIGVMASSFSDADLAQAAALFAAFVLAVPRAADERRDTTRAWREGAGGEGDRAGGRDVSPPVLAEPAEVGVTPRPPARSPSPPVPSRHADVVYAALLSGIAIGVKVSAGPTALIILAMFAWRGSTPGTRRRVAAQTALVFAAGWLATAGYWYARNVVHTGNPLYPAAFLFWPGATFPYTTLREYAGHYGVGRAVTDALVVYLDWPWPHAALALLGLAGLAVWPGVRGRAMPRPQRFFAGGALAITAVTLVLLPSTPYSAGNGMTFVSGFVHWDSMRYVALLPILGWVALGALVDAGAGAPHARTLVAAGVTAAAVAASPITWGGAVAVLIVGAVLALAVSRVGPPSLSRRAAVAAAVATAVVVAGAVAWFHGAKAAATAGAFLREPLYGGAIAVLDRQPVGTRVAVFGDQWIYPTFGARHHLVPVRLDRDGRVATTPIGDAMEPGTLTVDPWTFRRNLAESYIGIVAVVHLPHPGRAPEWPAQAMALERVRGSRLLYRDGAVGIWKLGD